MLRLEAMLVTLVVLSALGAVAAHHQSRKLFAELEREQSRARQLEVEWGQLQLEQSTWAAHSRVEQVARDKLGLTQPAADHLMTAEVR